MSYHRDNCRLKRRYRSHQVADHVLAEFRERDPEGAEGLHPYRCPFCRRYHLGHTPSMESLESIALEVRGLK